MKYRDMGGGGWGVGGYLVNINQVFVSVWRGGGGVIWCYGEEQEQISSSAVSCSLPDVDFFDRAGLDERVRDIAERAELARRGGRVSRRPCRRGVIAVLVPARRTGKRKDKRKFRLAR